jgi:hypothetical protein
MAINDRITRTSLEESAGFGVIAGLILLGMEIASSVAAGLPPITPLRFASSIVLGSVGLEVPFKMALAVGVPVHLGLSFVFGVLHSVLSALHLHPGEPSAGNDALLGFGFGLALWFVNFELIGQAFYPWFLAPPALLQAFLHAVFFGLPLGRMQTALRFRPRYPEEVPPMVHNDLPPDHREM